MVGGGVEGGAPCPGGGGEVVGGTGARWARPRRHGREVGEAEAGASAAARGRRRRVGREYREREEEEAREKT